MKLIRTLKEATKYGCKIGDMIEVSKTDRKSKKQAEVKSDNKSEE